MFFFLKSARSSTTTLIIMNLFQDSNPNSENLIDNLQWI